MDGRHDQPLTSVLSPWAGERRLRARLASPKATVSQTLANENLGIYFVIASFLSRL
jgi:hypothetical protein